MLRKIHIWAKDTSDLLSAKTNKWSEKRAKG
jgi:hypothetical protein